MQEDPEQENVDNGRTDVNDEYRVVQPRTPEDYSCFHLHDFLPTIVIYLGNFVNGFQQEGAAFTAPIAAI
jgi:hypothetical protein